MHAAVITRFGGPEVIEVQEVAEPVPGPGEILVDVAFADVLLVETQIRRGLADWFPLSPPFVGGQSLSGTVAAVGPGESLHRVGDRVVAFVPAGAYAPRAIAASPASIAVPRAVPLDAAVACTHDGQTAVTLLRTMPAETGETALITGAAGGMGLILAQLLTADGVHVLGAARGASKLQAVRAAGARPVDYGSDDWPAAVRAAAVNGVDVVYDGVGGAIGRTAMTLTRDGGRFSAHGFASGEPGPARSERGIRLQRIEQLQNDRAAAVDAVAACMAAVGRGSVRIRIDRVAPLDGVADLHRALEARDVVGKALVAPGAVRAGGS